MIKDFGGHIKFFDNMVTYFDNIVKFFDNMVKFFVFRIKYFGSHGQVFVHTVKILFARSSFLLYGEAFF